jgi:hypothetical protein
VAGLHDILGVSGVSPIAFTSDFKIMFYGSMPLVIRLIRQGIMRRRGFSPQQIT